MRKPPRRPPAGLAFTATKWRTAEPPGILLELGEGWCAASPQEKPVCQPWGRPRLKETAAGAVPHFRAEAEAGRKVVWCRSWQAARLHQNEPTPTPRIEFFPILKACLHSTKFPLKLLCLECARMM